MHDYILYTEGIPRWFSRIHHMIDIRKCNRVGHHDGEFVCQQCGQVLNRMGIKATRYLKYGEY